MDLEFLIGLLVGGLGVGISLLAWWKPRQFAPKPVWVELGAVPLVSNEIRGLSDIRVTVRDRPYVQLTLWTGKFWNGGRSAIRKEDVVAHRLKFQFTGAEIVGSGVLGVTRPETCFSVSHQQGHSDAEIAFDFLDYRDGAEFFVIHSGPPSLRPIVRGAVIGSPVIKTRYPGPPQSWAVFLNLMTSLVLLAAFGGLASIVMGMVKEDPSTTVGEYLQKIISSVSTWVFVGMLILMFVLSTYWEMKERFTRQGEPDSADLIRFQRSSTT